MSPNHSTAGVRKRISFLKRNARHDRASFSAHYENNHGPLAAGLAGFRKFATRYVQNHVEDADDGREPLFDGVTMTTQVPRADYTKGFFHEPDYEKVKPDEIYLFDLERTVSVLGQEEVLRDGAGTPFKALILSNEGDFPPSEMRGATRLVVCRLDTAGATALGFRSGLFAYGRLLEAWFESQQARQDAERAIARLDSRGAKPVFLPVREVTIFSPESPWPSVPDA